MLCCCLYADNSLIAGEDVGHYGGSYKVTYDLYKKYGEMRLLDTPICGKSPGIALHVSWNVLARFCDYTSKTLRREWIVRQQLWEIEICTSMHGMEHLVQMRHSLDYKELMKKKIVGCISACLRLFRVKVFSHR